jgi:hypothetical protein
MEQGGGFEQKPRAPVTFVQGRQLVEELEAEPGDVQDMGRLLFEAAHELHDLLTGRVCFTAIHERKTKTRRHAPAGLVENSCQP